MQIKSVVEGKHNKESFRFHNGKLDMFGRTWDKADIKTLVETANLLSVEGYNLKTPIGTRKQEYYGMFGPQMIEVKQYDDDIQEGE